MRQEVLLSPKNNGSTIINIVQTVNENEQMFTPRQLKHSKKAQCAYVMMGRLSIYTFKNAIQKMITNCPVSIDDVKRAIHIYMEKI